MLEKLGGRKFFLLILLAAIGTTVELYSKNGLSEQLRLLLIWVGGVYIFGNVGVNMAGAIKSNKDQIAKEEIASLRAGFEQLNANQNAIYESMTVNTQATTQIAEKLQGR